MAYSLKGQSYFLLIEYEAQQIVAVGINQEQKQDGHAGYLRVFEELIARFPPRDDLVEEEHDVPAVQRRYRQDVHEREDERKPRATLPKELPVPNGREEVANRPETAEARSAFLREDVFHVVHVARQRAHALFDSGRERGEETVGHLLHLVKLGGEEDGDAYFAKRVGRDCQRVALMVTVEAEGQRRAFVGIKGDGHVVERRSRYAIDRDDAIPGLEAGDDRRSVLDGQILHHHREAEAGEALFVAQEALHHVARHGDDDLLALAEDGNVAGLHDEAGGIFVETLEGSRVGLEEDVAVAEADVLERLAIIHTHLHVLQGQIRVAPVEEHHRVDKQGEDEVEQDAAHHDEQTLAGRLRAELVGLGRFGQLLLVHAFVDHAGNLAVAAEGEPADAVFRLAVLRFEFEEREPRVKEKVELFDAHFEKAGEKEVPELMDYHEDRKTQDELQGFDKKCLH